METIAAAAKRLRKRIGAPRWAVSIWTWRDDDGTFRLIVKIDPRYALDRTKIPRMFAGFPVTVENRENAVAGQK
jgi:hypothetical protein